MRFKAWFSLIEAGNVESDLVYGRDRKLDGDVFLLIYEAYKGLVAP